MSTLVIVKYRPYKKHTTRQYAFTATTIGELRECIRHSPVISWHVKDSGNPDIWFYWHHNSDDVMLDDSVQCSSLELHGILYLEMRVTMEKGK
jgi:hypothetical protein